MVQMTMQMPDDLAKRIEPIRSWIPAILELSFIGFKTRAAETASEIIEFLSSNPVAQDVLEYHVSERGQARLERLLALNQAGLLSVEERDELDELEKIERSVVLLKTQIARQENQAN